MESDSVNERRFTNLLKKGDLASASRFALYFSAEKPSERQLTLLAQYALQTCQPQQALFYASKFSNIENANYFRAVVLALVSVPRPWTKPLLTGMDLDLEKDKPEVLKQEVWLDEWPEIKTKISACTEFPGLELENERAAGVMLSKDLFTKYAESNSFDSLFVLGLAMDVGYFPSPDKLRFYLDRFAGNKDHP